MSHWRFELSEEDKAVKVYDTKILRKLWRYARPYLKLLILNLFLLLSLTAFDLLLPYLQKIGVDNYIMPRGREYFGKEELPGLEESEGRKFLDTGKIPGWKLRELESRGVLSPEKYYILSCEKEDLVKGRKYFKTERHIFISPGELKGMNIKEKLALREGDIKGLGRVVFVYFMFVFLIFVFTYLQIYSLEYVAQRITYDIREELQRKLFSLSLSFFDKNPTGRLVTRVTNDVKAMNQFFTSVLVFIVKDFFIIFGILFIMFKLNPFLASFMLFFAPIIFLFAFFLGRKIRDAFRNIRAKLAKINSYLQESLTGIRVIQAFAGEKYARERFRSINTEFFLAAIRLITLLAFFYPFVEFISTLATAGVIYFGGKGILSSIFTFGSLVAFLSYIHRFFQPIKDLADKYHITQSAFAAAERIFTLLEEKEYLPEPERPVYPGIKGEIEFRNVWFSYDTEWVLKDVSFRIKPGEKVAFVGYTGAGKTTIINLILRLYDVKRGEILIDGVDIRKLEKGYLRRHIAIVSQDPFLFAGTIKDNITLWEDIPEERLKMAVEVSNLGILLEKREKGLLTEVGERGEGLSTGEKQLITIARALAFDCSIIIFDEATSSIDPETEHLIQEALWKVMEGRTTLIIAHRLSTIKRVGRIFVIHRGRIVEEGTHRELIERKGIYESLYRLQELRE